MTGLKVIIAAYFAILAMIAIAGVILRAWTKCARRGLTRWTTNISFGPKTVMWAGPIGAAVGAGGGAVAGSIMGGR
jgi:hypothetical protein